MLLVAAGHPRMHRIHLLVRHLLLWMHRVHLHVGLLLAAAVHHLLWCAAHLPSWEPALRRHLLHFQWVYQRRFVEHVEDDLHVVFPDAALLYDVLDLEGVDAHFLRLADQVLFQDALVHVKLLRRVDLLPERELRLNPFPFIFLRGSRLDILLLEKFGHLARNFLEGLLGKLQLIAHELPKGDKLHDITTHIPLVFLRIQRVHIRIQLIHGGEIGITDANNDDTQGIVRTPDYLVDRLLQVIDDTIGDDEQYLVTLIVVRDLARLAAPVDRAEDL